MVTASLCTIVVTMLGIIPGERAGWGTGDVSFRAYVRSSEHEEIYPVCAGRYTVEVIIQDVLNDSQGLLQYVTKVDICYKSRLNLVWGNTVEVRGTYYDGACPLAFCGRVEAIMVTKVDEWEEPEEEEGPEDIWTPWIFTASAEATETTATLQAVLDDDGGEPCRCRFFYRITDGPWWPTQPQQGVTAGSSFTQKIAALAPGTRYFFRAEARNSAGWTTGREGTFTTLVESVPPIPQPALWVSGPGQIDAASIAMVADIERDIAGPEEYLFDFVASPTGGAGGSDSIWQFSPIYTDVGLNPNQQYGYRVKARDAHGNETAYSPIRYEYTDIETPEGVSFGPLTTTSIQVKSAGALSGLARGQSGMKLENVTAGQMSAWLQENAYWTSDALQPNTRYTFRAQARNGDGEPTPFSRESSAYTLAIAPAAPVLANIATNQLYACWGSNGNPAGTPYWCENTISGKDSGWTLSTQWLDATLSPNTKYTYRVKARNGDGVETVFSASVSAYSAVETPTGITLGAITPGSIQLQSKNTPSGLDRGESGLWLENVTTGQNSSWRHDNSLWTTDNLLPNRPYGLRARARNGDGVQTPYCDMVYAYTHANVPGPAAFTGIDSISIQIQWGANGNPVGTLYLCENTTAGTNSGWTTDTAWTNTGLAPNTAYTYRVKARNAEGVETAWTHLGTQSTDYRSITINSTVGGQVSAPGEGTFRYAPGAAVSVTAAASGGYHFLRWTGSAVDAGRVADPNAPQTTVTVDAHYTLTANFLRTVICVDKRATGAGDGSSWENAFVSLQDALEVAQAGNEIRVAGGIYKPDAGAKVLPGDRLASFELKNGVALRGGYAGLALADPDTRDIAVYETVLSGDLNGDDRAVSDSYDLYPEISRTDNSIHVAVAVDAGDRTVLEGFTITAGNGIDGAGLCLIRGDLVVSQCIFRANRAGLLSGDGVSGWGEGAGLSCYQSSPILSDCVFQKNWVGGQGAAVFSIESAPVLKGCTFTDNDAGMQGGALYGEDSNSVFVDCAFHANWGGDGGAICHTESSDSRVTNCRFFGNAARNLGGAIYDAGAGLEVTNGVFSGNLAFADGGAVALEGGLAVLTNCTFNRNLAQGEDAGQALTLRGAMASLTNCILWDDVDATLVQIAMTHAGEQMSELTVSYCDILQGRLAIKRSLLALPLTWGNGNSDADPQLQAPAGPDDVAGTPDDDLRLQPGSTCVDAGDNTAVPTDIDDLNANDDRLERIPLDAAGQGRFVDRPDVGDTGVPDAAYPGIVDIGAYELPAGGS